MRVLLITTIVSLLLLSCKKDDENVTSTSTLNTSARIIDSIPETICCTSYKHDTTITLDSIATSYSGNGVSCETYPASSLWLNFDQDSMITVFWYTDYGLGYKYSIDNYNLYLFNEGQSDTVHLKFNKSYNQLIRFDDDRPVDTMFAKGRFVVSSSCDTVDWRYIYE